MRGEDLDSGGKDFNFQRSFAEDFAIAVEDGGAIGFEAEFACAQAMHFRPADIATAEGEEQAVEHVGPIERGDDGQIHPAVVEDGIGGDDDAAAVAGRIGHGHQEGAERARGAVGVQGHFERARLAKRREGRSDVAGHAGQAAETRVAQARSLGVYARAAGAGVEAGASSGEGDAEEVDAAGRGMEQGVGGFDGVEREAERASEIVAAACGKDPDERAGRGDTVDDVVGGAVAAQGDDAGVARGGCFGGPAARLFGRGGCAEFRGDALLAPVGFDGLARAGGAATSGGRIHDDERVGEMVHSAAACRRGAETIPASAAVVHRRNGWLAERVFLHLAVPRIRRLRQNGRLQFREDGASFQACKHN